MGRTAEMVPKADHHTICKFDNEVDSGFLAVLENLVSLKAELLARIVPPEAQTEV